MKACLLLLPLALAACMTMPESTTHAATNPPAETSLPVSATVLASHHWQLHDAVDSSNHRLDALFGTSGKPLQLDFSADRIDVSNACNHISGGYRIVDGHLVTTALLQTMMACADPVLMQRETTIKAVLRSKPTLIVSTGDDGTPLLTLAADSGQTLVFAGKPTAEARYGGPGETVFLEVAPQTAPCHHPLMPDKTCLQVRERHYDANGLRTGEPGPWQPLQQDIEGYAHEPGIRNVLRLSATPSRTHRPTRRRTHTCSTWWSRAKSLNRRTPQAIPTNQNNSDYVRLSVRRNFRNHVAIQDVTRQFRLPRLRRSTAVDGALQN